MSTDPFTIKTPEKVFKFVSQSKYILIKTVNWNQKTRGVNSEKRTAVK